MACAGIDFGSKTSVVAIARRGGIDVCANEVSNRATPSLVSFQGAERHIGESAASIAAQNHKNTVSGLQRLLGLSHTSPFAQPELARVTSKVVPHPATGACAAIVNYSALDDEVPDGQPLGNVTFSFEALAAMLVSNLMSTASAENKSPVTDLVVSVPSYYTHAQRCAMMNAASIANVTIRRILNEHAAIALSYGIFRTRELPDSSPIKVAFVDIGESSTTVSITAFTNSRCDVLSVASEPSLGGRDLDDIIVNKFAKHFKDTYSIDVLSKPKPTLRLRKESEKIKKILSTNAKAMLNIECLMNDIDVKGEITRDELLEIAEPLLARIKAVCEKAIADASLADGEELAAVEVVGGSTRVPAFKSVVSETFEKVGAPLRTTLNADECIARGCALMSAMLSPAYKVRDYAVNDIATVTIDVDKTFTDGSPVESLTVVQKGNTIPCVKVMKFRSPGPLTIGFRYKDVSTLPAAAESSQICSYLVDAPANPEAKVRAKVRVSGSGTVALEGAQLVQEVEEEEEVVVNPEPAAKESTGDATDNGGADGDSKMDDAPDMKDAKPTEDAQQKPEEVPPGDKMETDASKEGTPEDAAGNTEEAKPAPAPVVTEKRMVKKKKTTDLHVTGLPDVVCVLTEDLVKIATEKEAKMRAHDLYVRERSEALNSLEAYVYDLRSRIEEYGGDLKSFSTEDFRSSLRKDLDDTEEWIYSEEAEGASKSEFVKRKESLMAKAKGMLLRKKEFEERPVRIRVLEAAFDDYKKVLVPNDEAFAHIDDGERKTLASCVEAAALWLKGERAKQDKIESWVDPVLTCQMLSEKLKEVEGVCDKIKNKPKPEPKKEEPAGDGKEDGAGKGDGNAENGAGEEPTAGGDGKSNGEAMEVEKEEAKEGEKKEAGDESMKD